MDNPQPAREPLGAARPGADSNAVGPSILAAALVALPPVNDPDPRLEAPLARANSFIALIAQDLIGERAPDFDLACDAIDDLSSEVAAIEQESRGADR